MVLPRRRSGARGFVSLVVVSMVSFARSVMDNSYRIADHLPAVDLGALDIINTDLDGTELAIYESKLPSKYFSSDPSIIRKWVYIGIIFRYLALIRDTSFGLEYEWVEQTVQDLKAYETSLANAIKLIGWV